MPVLTHGPEGRYAQALFDLAEEQKCLSDVSAAMQVIAQALSEVPDLKKYLSSPVVPTADKAAALQDVLKKAKAPKLLQTFVTFLGQEQRIDIIEGIAFHFSKLVDADVGRVHAYVSSAAELTKEQRKSIEKLVKENVENAKEVTLHETVDEKLIAGVRVQIGSQEWDATMRHQLNRLKKQLTE